MRSFQSVVVFLFALVACVLAQSSAESYDATVYVTSTVYRVNTVTMSGSSSAVANSTSTIITASRASTGYPVVSAMSTGKNGTSVVRPTGSATQPSQSQFTGAAAALNANAYVAILAAGAAYLVL